MKFYLSLALILSFVFISCSKKDSTSDLSKNKQQTQTDNKNKTEIHAVDFTWSENGQDKKLSDYKGKVILLNFWATWCGPCKREIPDLSQLSNDLSNKDFKMIGISVDQNPSMLEGFLKSNKLSYTIFRDQGDLMGKYMSATGSSQDVIPQTYIIDKEGNVVEVLIGSRSKEDFLKIINKYL
jgi:peroxiredoxin